MNFQCRVLLLNPCRVSSVSFEVTVSHSGGSRERKITLDSTDPEIVTEKKNHELLETSKETKKMTFF
jgi:hypothetical protein